MGGKYLIDLVYLQYYLVYVNVFVLQWGLYKKGERAGSKVFVSLE